MNVSYKVFNIIQNEGNSFQVPKNFKTEELLKRGKKCKIGTTSCVPTHETNFFL